jgi:hypothetical protein
MHARMLASVWLAACALVALLVAGGIAATRPVAAQPLPQRLWLPLVATPSGPAGVYDCVEREFGLGWATAVLTLGADFSTRHVYNPPALGAGEGSWSYDPGAGDVQLTNFRWERLSYWPSGWLLASEFLPGPGFSISIECQRRPTQAPA